MALQLGIACRRKIPLHKLFCAHCWTMPSGSSSAPGRKFGRFSRIFHVFRAIPSWICILLRLKSSERIPTKITGKRKHLKEPVKFRNKTRFFIFVFINEQDHLRMNVAPDQTIILGLQIFLDHRSLSSIDQKILMTLSPSPDLPTPFFDLSTGCPRKKSPLKFIYNWTKIRTDWNRLGEKYKQNMTPFPHLKQTSQEAGGTPGVKKFQRKLQMNFKEDFFLGHPV